MSLFIYIIAVLLGYIVGGFPWKILLLLLIVISTVFIFGCYLLFLGVGMDMSVGRVCKQVYPPVIVFVVVAVSIKLLFLFL